MKSKAAVFLKQIISVVTSLVKAKSMAVKTKTSAMKTRLIIFSLLKNKKLLMSTISHKIHALLGQEDSKHDHDDDDDDDHSKAIVLYQAHRNHSHSSNMELVEYQEVGNEDEDDDRYPDLRHSLFDSDGDEFDDQTGSVIDLVRNAKEEGQDFSLEDEIDHVADLFIRRFHRQIKMQKQESFKRYQDMLDRSV